MTYNFLYNLFFKCNKNFHIYVTLTLECYMRCILDAVFTDSFGWMKYMYTLWL
jgi:hypothetical protein